LSYSLNVNTFLFYFFLSVDSPDSGFTLQDNFKVSCDKWVTDDPQITYEFLYKRTVQSEAQITSLPDDVASTILWYYGQFRETPANSLPVGDKNEEYRLPLVIKIINRFGSYSVFHLNVTVRNFLMRSLIDSFIHLFIHSFIHSFIHLFIH